MIFGEHRSQKRLKNSRTKSSTSITNSTYHHTTMGKQDATSSTTTGSGGRSKMGQRLFALAALFGTAAAQTEGTVQLVNGRTAGAYDGLLQVYYNSAWYSVCDDNFADEHAELVCQQLFGTSWTSWTTDLGHCYTPVTGGIVNLEWTVAGTTLSDNVEGSTTYCDHDEDVSVVCIFDASASTEDQALDLSCVAGDCAPGYKQCDSGGWNWCCGDDYPDCGDSWGWCEDRPSKKEKQTMQGVLIGIICGVVLFSALSILACCVCCPGCPMYRFGPKPAAAPPQASVEMAGAEMYPVVAKA